MILHGRAPHGRAAAAASPIGDPAALIELRRFANSGYLTRDSDAPPHVLYPARVVGDPVVAVSIADTLGLGGHTALTVGGVILANHDHALDDAVRYGRFDGQRLTLRAADIADRRASDLGLPLAAVPVAFAGRVARAAIWSQVVHLEITDPLEVLNDPLQPSRYAGTGGMEGLAALAGLPRPVTLGECFNISPVFLGQIDFGDGALPTYQSHWRAIVAHLAVRERGVEMAQVGTAPGIGQWRDWPGLGVFQLGFTPSGAITCDLRGDAVPSWAATTTEIVTRLLTSLSPSLPASALDAYRFHHAAIDLPGMVGWHSGTTEITVRAALDHLVGGAFAHLWTTREGKIALAAMSPPAATAAAEIDVQHQIEIEPLPSPASMVPLPALIEVEYGRTWTVLTDIAGAVPDALRTRLSTDSQVVRAVSPMAARFTGQSRAVRAHGLYVDATSAQARADAVRDMIDRMPTRLRVVTDRYRGGLDIGMTVRVARADVAGGWWSGVVIGWREWLASQRVELDLWG